MALELNFTDAEQQRFELTEEQQEQIKNLYEQVSKDIAKRASKAPRVPSDALRKVYLDELQKQVNTEIDKLRFTLQGVIEGNMGRVAEGVVAGNIDFLQRINFPVEGAFSHVPAEIVERVATGQLYSGNWTLSRQLWKQSVHTQKDVNTVIAKGIAENKSAYDIAKDLEKYVNPNARKDWEWSKVYPGTAKKVDYNAQRLARTMVSHAYQQAFVETTRKNPFVTKYQWEASNSERTCELCAERDGQYFDKDDLPLDHPNGMCTFVAVMEDSMEQIADRLADWVQGKEDPELDAWAKDLYGNTWEGRVYKSEPLIPGKNNPEITDSIRDYYLPQYVRDNLASIESLSSYNDFVEYFKAQGITLDTMLESLKTTRQNDDIPAVKELCQKLATGIDTYKTMFGEDALSKLTRIVLYDRTEDSTAAYYFNRIGENDPLAGTIRFSNWQADGRVVFHELAHAFQDSKARKDEDAVSFSVRMVSEARLDPKFSAYFGAAQDVIEAERFADAFGFGFSQGSELGMEFIDNVRRALF